MHCTKILAEFKFQGNSPPRPPPTKMWHFDHEVKCKQSNGWAWHRLQVNSCAVIGLCQWKISAVCLVSRPINQILHQSKQLLSYRDIVNEQVALKCHEFWTVLNGVVLLWTVNYFSSWLVY